jgi:nucleoside-diphosphate-sugar epimerase
MSATEDGVGRGSDCSRNAVPNVKALCCLVTGAGGFVGSALCKQLTSGSTPVELRLIVRNPSHSVQDASSTLISTLNPQTNLVDILSGVDVVIHLASRVHITHENNADAMRRYREDNVDATMHLAKQAVLAGVSRFIFISSVKVHGEYSPPACPIKECDALCPMGPYAQSKLDAENQLMALAAQTGLELVIVRPPLVYGPNAKANFASLMRAVVKGWPLPLANIHNRRSLIALDNLLDFIRVCMVHPAAANETFLVSDGLDISTPALIRGIAGVAGVRAVLLPVPLFLLQVMGYFTGRSDEVQRLSGSLQVDISKARKLLGWSPSISVEEGLRRAIVGARAK